MCIFTTIVAAIIVLLILLFFYMGFFSKVEITEKEMGPYRVAYGDHTGPYKGVGPIMDKVFADLKADGIETTRGFGVYYDNPKKVEASKLRSISGCIVEEKDYGKLEALGDKYKVKTIERKMSIYTEFPWKNKASVIFSLMKVYPKLNLHIKEKGYGSGYIMEIYDIPAGRIEYAGEIKTSDSTD